MKKVLVFILTLTILISFFSVDAETTATPIMAEFFIAENGNDNNDGSINAPFKSIEKARDTVRAINGDMNGDIVVYFRKGLYCLDDTFTLEEKDSGTNGYYVRYKAYNAEEVTLSGGKRITGWERYGDALWRTEYSGDMVPQLYVNNRRARRAQSEKLYYIADMFDDAEDNTYQKDGLITKVPGLAAYKNQEDIQLHFARGWKNFLLNVVSISKTADGEGSAFLMRQPTFNEAISVVNHPLTLNVGFWLENAFEELDRPGEFYFNRQEKMLYYMPYEGEDMQTADVQLAFLEKLIDIKGGGAFNKVKNIVFDGLTMAHATWYRPQRAGLVNDQAQTISADPSDPPGALGRTFVPANIQLTWAERIQFTNNVIKDMGCVGIGLYEGVNYSRFTGNVFEDISDSAITIGTPYQAYIDAVHDGRNLAADKPATASGSDGPGAMYAPEHAVDVNPYKGWSSYGAAPHWWQVDLLDEYRIDRIEIVPRPGYDMPSTRADFEILGSNDPEFKTYSVLAVQGSEPFDTDSTAVFYSEDTEKYRYVRLKKTNANYLYLAEIRIINESLSWSPAREICKFNKVDNNYITRAGLANYGAPGIQTYYTQGLDISHNEVHDLSYSGICIGWDWGIYPDSITCRDNRVNYNLVYDYMNVNYDGGGLYALSQQPNSMKIGNYVKGQPNVLAPIYSDNGTKFFTIKENVVENAPLAIFSSAVGDTIWKDNYSTIDNYSIASAENLSFEEPKIFIPGNPPMEALEIMEKAGIEPEYLHIREKASENMWKVPRDITYANAMDTKYGMLIDSRFVRYYLDSIIASARKWLAIAKIGHEMGMYPQSAADELRAVVEEAALIAKKEPVDRHEVLDARKRIEETVQKFSESRITLSMPEMIDLAEKELSDTVIGEQVGNSSQGNFDKLKNIIEKAKNAEVGNDIVRLMLEKSIENFRKNKISLDIKAFKLPGQIGETVIDNAAHTIDVKVRYSANLASLVPKIEKNELVKITPDENDLQNFNNPVYYTVSTTNGEASRTYAVRVTREVPFSSDEPYSLKEALEDEDGWNLFGEFNTRQYRNLLFGDITLEFNAKTEYREGDSPGIMVRSQDPDLYFQDGNNSCYLIVFKSGTIELHRFNKGAWTQFYGPVPDVVTIFGDGIKTDAFKPGVENHILLTCKNVHDGVQICLTVNGMQIFNVIDNYEGAITEPGYLGTISPIAVMDLSAE